MPKAKLDHAVSLAATCEAGKKKTDYWDTIVPGFVLECRSTGGKTYYLRYIDQNRRQRQHKIGGFGIITFDQAKKEARRLRAEVELGGETRAASTVCTRADADRTFPRLPVAPRGARELPQSSILAAGRHCHH